MSGITVRLPLHHAPSEGYTLIQTMPETIRQNLRHLLLTNPGERIMDPLFGVGIKKYLFEPNVTNIHKTIESNILKQTKKYMPFLTIQTVDIVADSEDRKWNVSYNLLFDFTIKSDRSFKSRSS